MSFAHARIGRDDDRVKTVADWLGRNYTLDEKPCMRAEALTTTISRPRR